ncbi:MAG: DUF721 domain-containing protein [Gammaproteobacteria bacterium]|nr:DUF721 domain-containing protein [Gammaproteobacteria bacterium]
MFVQVYSGFKLLLPAPMRRTKNTPVASVHQMTSSKDLNSLSSLIQQVGRLAKVHQQCEQIDQLTLAVRDALPTNLKNHVTDAVFHNDNLVVFTDAAVWASQLRYYGDTIVTKLGTNGDDLPNNLRQNIPSIHKIVIKVRPHSTA